MDRKGYSLSVHYQGVNASSRDDTVSLENFGRALNFIDEYNQYRAKENADEGYSLSTNVGMNCRLMAVAEVNLDTSKDASISHTGAYHVGENLSWGYSDPFDGWYTEEKADFKNGATSGVGHYLNIVDYRPNGESSVNPTAGTGFAVHTAAPTYRVAHGQVFHTTSGYSQYNPTITYSTDEFRTQWFTPYYNAQVQAGMYGTTDEVKAEHRAALETAQQQLADAQATYDAAVAQQQAAEEASDAAAAESAAAAEQLAIEQGKTAGLEAALAEAQAAVTAAQAEAADAHAAYDEAAALVEQLKSSDEYAQAKADYKSAQQAVNDATAAEGLVYNGEPQEGVAASERYDVSNGSATDAGDYTATATLKDSKNYCWADGSTEPVQVSWTIAPAKVQVPTGAAGLIFTGEEQVGVPAGEHFSVSDNSAAEVGEHIAKASLLDKKNYCWSDGSTEDKQITWVIAGMPIDDATVSGIVAKKYTGAAQTQNISVRLNDVALVAGTDYTVSYKNNVKAGTATLIIEGAGNYGGTIERKFTIAKAANPLVASAKAKSVKYKDVKKKAKVVAKAITVSKAQGAVTYAKVKKGSSKKLSINKKTGKITVKKGTKKGTYTIKVNVTAAGNTNYAKGTKAVTVKVKVK